MKLISYVAAFNEAEYIEYAIRSTIKHVDRMIVIEGAWGESFLTSGSLHSNDGTIEILDKLKKEFNNLEIYFHNEKNQLLQRTKLFEHLNEDCYMLLQDADEAYRIEDIEKIKQIVVENKITAARFQSWTFVNDFYHVLPICFPRIFRLHKGNKYIFVGANEIRENGQLIKPIERPDVKFFHYSYVKTPERFMEKKRERTKIHGQFKWELRNGLVQNDNANVQEFKGVHPGIITTHPMFGIRKHKIVEAPEIVVVAEHSGIGNLIFTTPCLKAIRKLKPNAQIYLCTWPRAARILEGIDFVDNVVSSPNELFLHSLGRKIDHIFLAPVGAAIKPDALALCKNVFKHPITPPWGKHEIEVNMDFARKLGYTGPTPHTEIKIFNYNEESVAAKLDEAKVKKPFICISAAYLKSDHWPLKHWGNHNYTELLNQLPPSNIVFIGSEADAKDADQIITSSTNKTHRVVNACGFSPDIKDTAALISRSQLVVGNDGGLLHVAAALDIPAISLFTFTSPIKNAPVGKGSKVVMNPCPDRIMCQHGNFKKCQEKNCLKIPVIKVIEAIKPYLNQ